MELELELELLFFFGFFFLISTIKKKKSPNEDGQDYQNPVCVWNERIEGGKSEMMSSFQVFSKPMIDTPHRLEKWWDRLNWRR